MTLLGQETRIPQSQFLRLPDKALQLRALGRRQATLLILGHQHVEPFLLGPTETVERVAQRLEGDQFGERDPANLTDCRSHAQIESPKGLIFLRETVQALQVGTHSALLNASMKLRDGKPTLIEQVFQ